MCDSKACQELSERLRDFMIPTTNPCENFVDYACGKFLNETEIPPHREKLYASFGPLKDNIYKRGKYLLENEEESPFKTDNLARGLYKSCMNLSQIDSDGLSYVKKIMKVFGGWPAVEGKYFFHLIAPVHLVYEFLAKTQNFQ